MARKTHVTPGEEDIDGPILYEMRVYIKPEMRRFLELEAKRINGKKNSKFRAQDIVKALVTAYYEKRMMGLVINPND